jgi:MarR family 2-MHQ and catechol resistance regulon transcriptional repressor
MALVPHLIGSVQREDERELNERVMISLVMASEMFKKKSSAMLKQYGVTFSHYNVLKYLVACGRGSDTIGNVSKRMRVTAANMTGIAKRMEKAGLIEKKNDDQDDRLTLLHITPRGTETLAKIREDQEQHGLGYLEFYSRSQKEEILRILEHILQQGRRPPIHYFD